MTVLQFLDVMTNLFAHKMPGNEKIEREREKKLEILLYSMRRTLKSCKDFLTRFFFYLITHEGIYCI